LKNLKVNVYTPREDSLWRGPEVDGITQSMLAKFLICRERFRVRYVLGLQPPETWNHRTGYGDMWHVCEEALAKSGITKGPTEVHVRPLVEYCKGLCRQYPMQQEDVDKWYNVCKIQFPAYVDYWRKHPDVKDRVPMFQEQVFDVPYKLPSGRVVRLRGKWDSVDQIGKGKDIGIRLQENKTKGDIYEPQMRKQLRFDLQTMLYLVALHHWKATLNPLMARFAGKILGVRYNVVRRPLSGGKGSIKQCEATKGAKCPKCKGSGDHLLGGGTSSIPYPRCPKCNGQGRTGGKPAETKEHFYARLRDDYILAEPEYWFMRWQVDVTQAEITKFCRDFLTPILEQMCYWWEWISSLGPKDSPFADPIHFRMPYGIYSPLIDGGATEQDDYLDFGSLVGLRKGEKLFAELA